MNITLDHPQSPFHVIWNADSSVTVLGRLAAADASGSATGVDGEGNWLQVIDFTSLSYSIYNLETSETIPITGPTLLTVADVILDTPVDDRVLWTLDRVGYNLRHDLGPSAFPEADDRYLLLYHAIQSNTRADEFYGQYIGRSKKTARS